jgi:hypothetical protein
LAALARRSRQPRSGNSKVNTGCRSAASHGAGGMGQLQQPPSLQTPPECGMGSSCI